MATISQNIKRIRTKQGLTQDDLARIEGGGVTKPSVQTIQKIAKSLGVPMEDMVK